MGNSGEAANSAHPQEFLTLARLVTETLGVGLIVFLFYDKLNRPKIVLREKDTQDNGKFSKVEQEKLAFEETFANAEATENFTSDEFFNALAGNQVVQSDLDKVLVVTDTKLEKAALESSEHETDITTDTMNLEQSMISIKKRKQRPRTSESEKRASDVAIVTVNSDQEIAQREIKELRNSLEANEAKLKLAKFDLSRERSRNELLHKELKVQEVIFATKSSQLEEIIREGKLQIEKFENQAKRQTENLLERLNSLEIQYDVSETSLKEKEESNIMLRQDMLSLMSNYSREKESLEKRLQAYHNELKDLRSLVSTQNEQNEKLRSELKLSQTKCEKSRKSKKKIQRDFAKIQDQMKDMYRHNERGIKVSRLLDQIDNID